MSGAAIYGLLEIVLALAPTYESFAVLAIPTGLAILTKVTAANSTNKINTDETVTGRGIALD